MGGVQIVNLVSISAGESWVERTDTLTSPWIEPGMKTDNPTVDAHRKPKIPVIALELP